MDWMNLIPVAIKYIEDHLTDDITVDSVAKEFNVSTYFFQKGFMMLCGYSVSEYIRNRRLTLAGNDLISKGNSVTDIAMKYFYDSPDSFTKAFSRFHGASPSAVRRGEKTLKAFAPLKVKLVLEGGYTMDYRMVKRDDFTIIGKAKVFPYDIDVWEINRFWQEVNGTIEGRSIAQNYGVNIDIPKEGASTEFEYLVAELYDPEKDYLDGLEKRIIPAMDWVVFPCVGPEPETLMRVNQQIYSEWLPTLKEYEVDGRYCFEYYDDIKKYENGVNNENYYIELWLPIRKKTER